MSTVLVVGVAVMDFMFFMDEFPTRPEKYRADQALVTGGGCGGNAAVAIARLGGDARLATRLGNDAVGRMIADDLIECGVDLKLTDRSGRRSSYSSIVVAANGDRQIVNFRGDGLAEHTGAIRDAEKVDAVLVDTRWPEGACEALRRARHFSVPGIVDGEAPLVDEVLSLASHIAFSEQGLADFAPGKSRADALRLAAEKYDAWVCVTHGESGVTHVTADGRLVTVPAFNVETKDTAGAGDVWHGAFALALAEGQTEHDAVRFSNAVAALKCARIGGRSGTPTRDETEEFLKETST